MPLNSVDITVLAREAPLANSISRAIGRGLQQSGGQLKQFEGELDRANKRVAAFAASASLLYGTVNALKALVSESIKVEKSLASINSIFGLTGRELNSFSKDLFDVARQTGQSFDIAAKAAEEFSRQGLSVAETGKRTRDALLLVRLTGLDVTKAVDGLTAAMATFGKTGIDTTEILNKIVAADQKFAVSAKDIIDAFARTGNVVADAGASLEEFVGLVTAARQITSREGSVIGNSLKTIFTRLEREDTIQKLEALGVAVRDTSGETLKGYQVFQNLAGSYRNLTREQQRYVDELGAGVFQINQFKAIVGDAAKTNGIAASAQRTAANATNEALIRNEALNQTMATSLQTLKTNATQAAAVIGKLSIFPALNNLATGSSTIIESFFQKTDAETSGQNIGAQIAENLLVGFGKVLEGPGLIFAARVLTGLGKKAFSTFGKDILETSNFVSPGGRANILSREKEAASLTTINSLLSQGTREEQARFLAAKAVSDQEAILLGILERQAAIQARLAGVPAPSFAARRVPKAAEGYVAALGAERRAISQGVGGAPSSARAVFLPNFNRGNGQRGIVANTSEFYVPGAAGGSIYSQEMVQRFGLPPGATPIAAGGYPDPSYYKNLGFGGKRGSPFAFGVSPGPYSGSSTVSGQASGQGFGQLLQSFPEAEKNIDNLKKEIDGLFSSLKKAVDLDSASKLGIQIQDLAKSLSSVDQKSIGKRIGQEFPNLITLAVRSALNGGKKTTPAEIDFSAFDQRTQSGVLGPPNSPTGATGPRRIPPQRLGRTFPESYFKRDFGQLTISDLIQGTGNNTSSSISKFRNDSEQTLRRQVLGNFVDYKTGNVNSGNLSAAIGATQTVFGGKTYESQFNQTIQAQLKAGKDIESAYKTAISEIKKETDNRAEINRIIRNSIPANLEFEKQLKEQQALKTQEVQAIRKNISRQVNLNKASEEIAAGKSTAELSGVQRAALIRQIREKAIADLGFGGQSTTSLYQNRDSRTQIEALVKKRIGEINESVSVRGKIDNELISSKNKQEALNRLDNRASRVQQILLGGTLASGFIPSGTSGEITGQLSGGSSGLLQGGSLGAAAGGVFGPKGLLVGAGIGALFGAIKGFIDRSSKSFEELAAELEKANSKSAQRLDAVSQFINLQGNIKEAFSGGASKTVIGSLQRKQNALIPNIGSALEREIILAGSDEDRLQDILARVSAEDSELRAKGGLAGAFNSLGKGFNLKDASSVGNTLFSSGLRSQNASAFLARIKAGEGEEDLTLSSDGVNTFNKNIEKNIRLKEDLRKEFSSLVSQSSLTPDQKQDAITKAKEAGLETLVKVFESFAKNVDNSDLKIPAEKLKLLLEPLQQSFPRLLRERQNALELAGISGQGSIELKSIRNRASLNLGDLTESEISRRGSAFSVGEAQERARLSNFLSLEATRNSFFEETRQTKGFAQRINDASTIGDFEAITKDKALGQDLGKKLEGILQESRKTVNQNEIQISLAKEQARIEGFILEAQKNQRLLSSGTYSGDTNSVARGLFDSLSVSSGAGRRKDQIDLGNYLTQIGLPQTDLSLSSDRELRTQSVRDNLSQVLSARLRRNVGSGQIESALDELGGRPGDAAFVSRVRSGLDNLKNYDPSKIREELLGSGASVETIKAAATAGDLSTGNLLLNKPLTAIEDYTKRSADLLAQIYANDKQQTDIRRRLDLEVDIADKQRQIGLFSNDAAKSSDPQQLQLAIAALTTSIKASQEEIDQINGRIANPQKSYLPPAAKGDRNISVPTGQTSSEVSRGAAFRVNESAGNFNPKATDVLGTLSGGFRSGLEKSIGPLDNIKTALFNLRDVGERVGQSLENNLSNAFGDFVTGAKSGKDAFRDFTVSILNDAARAFASKAIQSLLGLIFSSAFGAGAGAGAGSNLDVVVPTGGSYNGGFIGRNSGGGVPVALTGGEYLFSPGAARNIGSSTLNALNTGSFQKKAAGGTIVRGGSGFKDDLFGRAPAGSFVVRKAMTERYGGGFLDSLAKKASSPYINGGFIGFTDGGPVGMMQPPSPTIIPGTGSGGSTSVNVGVTVNDNSTSSSSSASGGVANNRAFGEQLGQAVKQTVLEVLDQQARVGGRLYQPALRGR